MTAIDRFFRRPSTPSRLLAAPGPDPAQRQALIDCALRVPDHGKLAPWRVLWIEGDARRVLADTVLARALEREPALSEAARDKEQHRFLHAPCIATVIACPVRGHKVPEIEQLLSGGALCFAMLQSAQALGFGAQWLTGWMAYDTTIHARLGLQAGEQILGFIHIGTAQGEAPERLRPNADNKTDGVDTVSTRVHLVDSSLYIFRAWHSYPVESTDAEGWPVNAVHGFARFLCELLERTKAPHVALAFDEALDSCFRNTLYPAYKANRDAAPEELKRQFAHCKALGEALGLPTLAHPNYEADDLIGTAATLAREAGHAVVVVSADKDMAQLLDLGDEQWDFGRNERWGADGVKARYGIHAHQVADYLGLTGDAIDNIPGVPGIGPKTAATLLAIYDSLDNLLSKLDEVPLLKLRGAAGHAVKLKQHRDAALLSRQLATIARDAPMPADFAHGRRRPINSNAIDALCERLRIGPMTRRRLLDTALREAV